MRAVLVDDERLARENLELLLEEFCPEVQVVGKAGGVEEGLTVIGETTPDVLFLDIRMPSGAEGFDLLAQLPNRNFQVVFVTAFKDYAIRAMNASAVHYVLKPIDIEDLQHAVRKLVDVHQALTTSAPSREQYAASLDELQHTIRTQGKPQRLTLYHNRGFRMVDVAENAARRTKSTFPITQCELPTGGFFCAWYNRVKVNHKAIPTIHKVDRTCGRKCGWVPGPCSC